MNNTFKFFKGILHTDLKDSYVPGTVTRDFKEALMWKERIESKKKKGASQHVKHGKALIIEITYVGEIHSHDEFQKAGVEEHSRMNCWTSVAKNKAQINTVCQYRILTVNEINNLYKP